MVLQSTYFVGAVSGVYNHLKLAVTASRSAAMGLITSKKIEAPSWPRSSTRRSNFGIGHDDGGIGAVGGMREKEQTRHRNDTIKN